MTYIITHINEADKVLTQKFSYDTECIGEAISTFEDENSSQLLSINGYELTETQELYIAKMRNDYGMTRKQTLEYLYYNA